jgi:hypothetical protein
LPLYRLKWEGVMVKWRAGAGTATWKLPITFLYLNTSVFDTLVSVAFLNGCNALKFIALRASVQSPSTLPLSVLRWDRMWWCIMNFWVLVLRAYGRQRNCRKKIVADKPRDLEKLFRGFTHIRLVNGTLYGHTQAHMSRPRRF